MKEAVKPEPGNGSSDGGLPPVLVWELKKLIEPEVEKSENRVLRAIADFKGDLDGRLDRMGQRLDQRMDRMDERLDRMDGRLDDLAKVKGAVYVITALLAVLLGSGFITWWLSRLAA